MLSQLAQQKILIHLYDEEEYRQFAYDDKNGQTVKAPIGNLTIALGWNIQENGCPKKIAEFAAMYFVNKRDAELSQTIDFYDALDDVRKVVLCDMAYNMGTLGVLKFKEMLAAMQKKDWRTAAIAMLNSKWANDVGNRAVVLSHMMELGQWTTANQS